MPDKRKAKNFKYEISAGAVIFRETSRGREYLLLLYDFPAGKSRHSGLEKYWGFPKGLVEKEKKESLEEAARREIQEETGLSDISFLPGFKKKIHYFFRHEDALISKDAVYFLAKARPDAEVKISWEHSGFEWLPYLDARKHLTHKNHQEVLDAAETFLKKIANGRSPGLDSPSKRGRANSQ